jgi:hypothetical protein
MKPSWCPTSDSPFSSWVGEHDLVAKGGSRGAKIKEVLLGGDGVHAERRLLVLVTG